MNLNSRADEPPLMLACGRNSWGQLGLGHTSNQDSLQPVPTTVVPMQVASSFCHTCIVTEEGALYMCGNNSHGELGAGHTNNLFTLTRIAPLPSGVRALQVACGHNHTFVVAEGVAGVPQLFACGCNNSGQLGLGHTTNAVNMQLSLIHI